MLPSRPSAVAAAIVLLFAGLPGRAQYAFNSVARPVPAAAGHDPEENPKTTPYKTVHGVVQSRQGVLPGATVWLHGSRTVVVTNAEGEFELRVPANAQVIELTCGYAGLQDEVLRVAPAQALGSVYLLRPHTIK
ncbi:carboxypeptidase-like regulatory domain-containing protein [Hymenobacter sp. DH14]|uniref:Carboxypeptidase-like regulatory domain-containing protein n=1 Tax=Hymenobacter cyanobacteriorum TaxID=2926463 RepID=A0A9X1VIN2_9BACT|nr:carboxypeptidase-like regulatory domain-containing protein [Hymenobacter cyanobacteriorum]MCI1189388.1 carboxypeptidase-like regulatory domain-containing protein [Hymenobacter cyanobacteriorum]